MSLISSVNGFSMAIHLLVLAWGFSLGFAKRTWASILKR